MLRYFYMVPEGGKIWWSLILVFLLDSGLYIATLFSFLFQINKVEEKSILVTYAWTQKSKRHKVGNYKDNIPITALRINFRFLFSQCLYGTGFKHISSLVGVTLRLGSSYAWNKVLFLLSESITQKPAMLRSKRKRCKKT